MRLEHKELVVGSVTGAGRSLQPRIIPLCLILLASGLTRLWLFHHFPALLTNDSWGYVAAAETIHDSADFFTGYLGDVRMPAYPTFLALTQPVTRMVSSHIVLLQKAIGMLTTLLGAAVGIRLGSWWIANALALFLGLSPIFLLFEHTVMPDTLFVFSLLSLILLFLWSVEGGLAWHKAVGMGAVIGTCVVTRPSAVPLCALFALGTVLVRYARDRTSLSGVKNQAALAAFFSLLILTALLVVGPWLWRNRVLFDKVSLVNYDSRNLLIYKAMHDDLDLTLPLMKQVNASLSMEHIEYLDYGWLGSLSRAHSSNEAERIAHDLLWEQITSNPGAHLQDMSETFFSFGGLSPTSGNDRFALRFWFKYLVHDAEFVSQVNVPPSAAWGGRDFVYVPAGGNSVATYYWSLAGLWYLDFVRPALFIVFFLVLVPVLSFRNAMRRDARAASGIYAALVCGCAYLVTILGHTLTLTDNDRYIASLDLLSFLASVTLATYWYRLWSSRQKTGEVARTNSTHVTL